ncbi:MAG: riboflavin synthase [Agriterribacter sp.]
MFTGIIEACGTVISTEMSGSNRIFWVKSPISHDLKVDQSVSHNGVCLTVEELKGDMHRVTAIHETLNKTNLGTWQPEHKVNLERCLMPTSRLDGHFVQGHVDSTAVCTDKQVLEGSWQFRLEFPEKFSRLVIEKGSISLNGISLTIFDVTHNQFSVAIIPYTFNHTNMSELQVGDSVNLEFDMVGKYVVRGMELGNAYNDYR